MSRGDILIRQLQGLLGGSSFSSIRQASESFPAGVSTLTVDTAGVSGIVVVQVIPASHWSFSWFPHHSIGGIVVNNTGAPQSIVFRYFAVL